MDHGSILVFVPQTRRLEHSVSVPALQQWSRPMSNNATVHFRAMPAGSQALGTTGLHSHVSHGLRVLALRRHGWSPRCPSEAESGLQFLSSNVLSACRRSAFCGRDGGPPYSRKVRQRPQHQPSTRPTSCAAQMLSDSRHRVSREFASRGAGRRSGEADGEAQGFGQVAGSHVRGRSCRRRQDSVAHQESSLSDAGHEFESIRPQRS